MYGCSGGCRNSKGVVPDCWRSPPEAAFARGVWGHAPPESVCCSEASFSEFWALLYAISPVSQIRFVTTDSIKFATRV